MSVNADDENLVDPISSYKRSLVEILVSGLMCRADSIHENFVLALCSNEDDEEELYCILIKIRNMFEMKDNADKKGALILV